jgi:hypothetical protein
MSTNCPIFGVYSFEQLVVTIAGQRVQGFADGDDAVSVEPFEASGVPVVGADGAAMMSVSASRAARIRLKLMPFAPFNKVLMNYDRTRKQGAVPTPFNISIVNTLSGESGACTTAMIEEIPTRSEGKTGSEREWVIFAPCWIEDDLAYGA